MKINKKMIRVIFIATLIIICNSCTCYAISGKVPSIDSGYKPTAQGGEIINATNTILGIIIAIGAILITVFIALTGFGMILGSAEEKAVSKEKFAGYLIAAIILTSGATIAKIIINIAETFE